MNPTNTSEVSSGVYAVPSGRVNFYLLKSQGKYIAFDAGSSESSTLKELDKLNIASDSIAAVFLTHTDSDHVGGIAVFRQAAVYISEHEKQMIDGTTKRAVFMPKNKLSRDYKTLSDGEIVIIDNITVACVSTPGHTRGSACYVADGKYLFSGDNFSLKAGKAKPFIAVFNMDGNEQRNSIRKIAGLNDIEAIFTGHHGYTNCFDDAFDAWR